MESEGEALGLLQHLNREELERLLESEEKLTDLINDLPQVRNLKAEKEMRVASNRSLAEYNLSREPRLAATREKLVTTSQMAQELKLNVESYKTKLDDIKGPQSLDTVLALLQTSCAECEEKSEEIASNFVGGNAEPDAFLEAFLPTRVEANVKAVKVDKLRELLQERGSY